jgi:hypothetical protein
MENALCKNQSGCVRPLFYARIYPNRAFFQQISSILSGHSIIPFTFEEIERPQAVHAYFKKTAGAVPDIVPLLAGQLYPAGNG